MTAIRAIADPYQVTTALSCILGFNIFLECVDIQNQFILVLFEALLFGTQPNFQSSYREAKGNHCEEIVSGS